MMTPAPDGFSSYSILNSEAHIAAFQVFTFSP